MKKIIITIDDVPSPECSFLLERLKDFGIKAVLFCVGKFMESNISVLIKAVKMGHVLGNHSFNHNRFSKGPLKKLINEINATDALIKKVYIEADVPHYHKIFRFPFGDKGFGLNRYMIPFRKFFGHYQKLQKFLCENEYKNVRKTGIYNSGYILNSYCNDSDWFWTCDLREWEDYPWLYTEQKLIDVGLRPHTEILLLHDHVHTHSKTIKILQFLKESGVVFENPLDYIE